MKQSTDYINLDDKEETTLPHSLHLFMVYLITISIALTDWMIVITKLDKGKMEKNEGKVFPVHALNTYRKSRSIAPFIRNHFTMWSFPKLKCYSGICQMDWAALVNTSGSGRYFVSASPGVPGDPADLILDIIVVNTVHAGDSYMHHCSTGTLHFATECIYVLHAILTVNTDHMPKQLSRTGLRSSYTLCSILSE